MNTQDKVVTIFRPEDRLKFLEELNQALSTRGWRVEDVTIIQEDDGKEGNFVFLFQLHDPDRPVVAVFHYWEEWEPKKEEIECEYEREEDEPEPQMVPTWKMWNGRFKWPSRWPDDEEGIWKAIRNFFKEFAGKAVLRTWCLRLIKKALESEELDGLKETVID